MKDQMKQAHVILVRHGTTPQNEAVELLQEGAKKGQETILKDYLDIYASPDLLDCPLSQRGIEMCQEAGKHIKDTQFHTVFVSPMYRAIQTALEIFKEHPDFVNIKFVVHPLMRERLHVSSDAPNTDIMKVLKEFYTNFSGNLDYTKYFDDYSPLWYVNSMDEDSKAYFKRQYDQGKKPDDIVTDFVNEYFPEGPEKISNAKSRVDKVVGDVRDYISVNQIKPEQKVCLVAHSMFFRIYTAFPEFWKSGSDTMPSPTDCANLMNCEFYPDSANFGLS